MQLSSCHSVYNKMHRMERKKRVDSLRRLARMSSNRSYSTVPTVHVHSFTRLYFMYAGILESVDNNNIEF